MSVPESASVYSSSFLRLGYDIWVLGVSNRFFWKAPSSRLQRFFDANASNQHLDVGVGTGRFLDRAKWPVEHPEITLLDVNPNSLHAAAHRIRRYSPKSLQADVFNPLPLPRAVYHSINLGYLLHCLPGNMEAKARVFANLKPHLHPDGVLFGSTILPDGCTGPGAKFMQIYNTKGIFSNAEDTEDGLRTALAEHFSEISFDRIGQVALFTARLPKA